MSEIKTLAQKMDIGRYEKLGNGIPKFSSPAAGKKWFSLYGGFSLYIFGAPPQCVRMRVRQNATCRQNMHLMCGICVEAYKFI